MRYIEIEDLEMVKSLVILDDLSDDNLTVIERTVEAAIEEISSYFTGNYKTEYMFAETTTARSFLMKRLIAEITIYHLSKRQTTDELPEYVKDMYSANIAYLKAVASGAVAPDFPQRDTSVEGKVAFLSSADTTNTSNFY